MCVYNDSTLKTDFSCFHNYLCKDLPSVHWGFMHGYSLKGDLFMKKNDVQNQADLYRQERKERLAKSSQKKAKRNPEAIKHVIKLRKIITAVLAVMVGLLLIYGALSFFGVPQKVLTAVKVGDDKISVAEYNYYYTSYFSNLYQTANEYEQMGAGYGSMMTGGFDYLTSPDLQSTKNAAEENVTWSEKIHEEVLKSISYYRYYYNKAVEAGESLSEETETEISDAIETLRETAKENNYSLNRFLHTYYGKGMNEKMFSRIAGEQYLVSQYLESEQEAKAESITDAQVDEIYNENPNDYDRVSIRIFGLPIVEETDDEESADDEVVEAEPTETEDGDADAEDEEAEPEPSKEKITLEEMMAKVTDEESFIELCKEYAIEDEKEAFENPDATLFGHRDYATVVQASDEETAKWAFDPEREAGDMIIAETSTYAYLIYVLEPAFEVTYAPVDVRHVLIQFKEEKDDEGNPIKITDEQKAEFLKTAEDLLDEWKSGAATEETFAQLANEHSDDAASIVGQNQEYADDPQGGLYENIDKGVMVPAFENWIFEEGRESGDTGIVETDYGYHIIYFIKAGDEPQWRLDIRNEIAQEYMTELDEAAAKEYEDSFETGKALNWAFKNMSKQINKTYYLY